MRLLAAVACLLISPMTLGAAEPKVVPADEAAEYVGVEVLVELTVKSSRLLESGKFCFLNSEASHTDRDNFTVAIRGDALEKFAKQGIAAPEEHYLKKQIRVRGKVALYKDKPQIVVDKPEQITTVVEIK